MWCERCGDQDRARLGGDEHGQAGWGVLCEGCVADLTVPAAAAPDTETASRQAWADGPIRRPSPARFRRMGRRDDF